MEGSRFSESRILVRGFHRLHGQDPKSFKENVRLLNRHFEQFNVDVAELCQWLMALRPGGKNGCPETREFWEFFLEPGRFFGGEDGADSCRRIVFDCIAGTGNETDLSRLSLSQGLMESIRLVASLPLSRTAERLFKRIGTLSPAHRQILLKSAADWIVARYWRGHENQIRQREEWQKEKDEWEGKHLELNIEVRDTFTAIFRELGIKDKKARLCSWERLKEKKDDCEWAGVRIGKKNHNGFCKKYREFKCENKKYFPENAGNYLKLRKNNPKKQKQEVMALFLKANPKARWFQDAWDAYLKKLNITEPTILKRNSGLLHCINTGEDCEYNHHTEKCELYRAKLDQRPDLQPLEGLYREWRREYLAGPKKPSFRYPSAKDLPMPKIFGKNYFRVDFERSELNLRLDDMPEGKFISFGFAPWPKDYQPQPEDMEITSVHINFVGVRARVGFRFKVPHLNSCFGISQDVIAELRSRTYPRKSQDQLFLNEARQRLLNSFEGGNPETDLKFIAVDLGTSGGSATLFMGKTFSKAIPLKIVKIEKLYIERKKEGQGKQKKNVKNEKGLSVHHVGLHLESWAEEARNIANARKTGDPELRRHDLRRLTLHTRWMIRDWARLNASQIIKAAVGNKVDLIVFESMRGWKFPGYDTFKDDEKRRLAFFAHGVIRKKVTEKALERGMRVVTVPYLYSSQFCAKCGKEQEDKNNLKKNKRDHRFVCEHKGCGNDCNSDENAARVLAKVFWGEIKLPVFLPHRA